MSLTADERALQLLTNLERKRITHLTAINNIGQLYDTIKDLVEENANTINELQKTRALLALQQKQKQKDDETIAELRKALQSYIPEESGTDEKETVSNPT